VVFPKNDECKKNVHCRCENAHSFAAAAFIHQAAFMPSIHPVGGGAPPCACLVRVGAGEACRLAVHEQLRAAAPAPDRAARPRQQRRH
jgi:hypothetical protein